MKDVTTILTDNFQAQLYGRDNWRNRRRGIVASLLFLGVWISYIIVQDSGSTLHKDVCSTLIYAAVAILMTWCFGAVADDWDKRKKIDPPPSVSPVVPAVESEVPHVAPGDSL